VRPYGQPNRKAPRSNAQQSGPSSSSTPTSRVLKQTQLTFPSGLCDLRSFISRFSAS
jgi:hypothetical protein